MGSVALYQPRSAVPPADGDPRLCGIYFSRADAPTGRAPRARADAGGDRSSLAPAHGADVVVEVRD